MKEVWIAEVIYPSGNIVSLGFAPSEAAGKTRCAKHALYTSEVRLVSKPLVWSVGEIDGHFSRYGSYTYLVSKR